MTVNATKDGLNVYYVTLTNVLYTNYNRVFSAIGYVEVAYESGVGKVYTTYSEENNARSVYQVACRATADEAVTTDAKEVLANYLSYTVNLVKDGDSYVVATSEVDELPAIGERKYSVENGVLTLVDIPQNLVTVLTDRPYVPVTIYDGTTAQRILVKIELNGNSATANLVVE